MVGTTIDSMQKLISRGRLMAVGNNIRFIRYFEDFSFTSLNNFWEDTGIAGFASDRFMSFKRAPKVIERCVL